MKNLIIIILVLVAISQAQFGVKASLTQFNPNKSEGLKLRGGRVGVISQITPDSYWGISASYCAGNTYCGDYKKIIGSQYGVFRVGPEINLFSNQKWIYVGGTASVVHRIKKIPSCEEGLTGGEATGYFGINLPVHHQFSLFGELGYTVMGFTVDEGLNGPFASFGLKFNFRKKEVVKEYLSPPPIPAQEINVNVNLKVEGSTKEKKIVQKKKKELAPHLNTVSFEFLLSLYGAGWEVYTFNLHKKVADKKTFQESFTQVLKDKTDTKRGFLKYLLETKEVVILTSDIQQYFRSIQKIKNPFPKTCARSTHARNFLQYATYNCLAGDPHKTPPLNVQGKINNRIVFSGGSSGREFFWIQQIPDNGELENLEIIK